MFVVGNGNVSAVLTKSMTTAANLSANTLAAATVAQGGVVTEGAGPAGGNSQDYLLVSAANSTNVASVLASLTATTTKAQLQAKLRDVTTVSGLTFAALVSGTTDVNASPNTAVNTDVLIIIEITSANVIVKYSVQTLSGLS